MSLTLELGLRWRSPVAGHHDRHWFTGVDPSESDLPTAFANDLLALAPGATATLPETPDPIEVRVIDASPEASYDYYALLGILRAGIRQQADFSALANLAEPYVRPDADDCSFYATPRLVAHLDSAAQAVWREFSGRHVRAEHSVLDLMASIDSHLPDQVRPARLVGLGMNAEELAHNPALTDSVIHDLNACAELPFGAGEFDIVQCALSIEYLACPEAVLRDVRRVLKPGGRCLITFSERWFPPKAVEPWPRLQPFARVAWVLRHLQRAGFTDLHTESLRGLPRPADDKYAHLTPRADPFYAVWGVS